MVSLSLVAFGVSYNFSDSSSEPGRRLLDAVHVVDPDPDQPLGLDRGDFEVVVLQPAALEDDPTFVSKERRRGAIIGPAYEASWILYIKHISMQTWTVGGKNHGFCSVVL